LLPAPLMKSPSQWPGMTRSFTSGGFKSEAQHPLQ
jgi:hypothetical protein